jgi:chromosome segregation ATPase
MPGHVRVSLIVERQVSLRDLNAEIIGRERYLKDQEAAIKELLEYGNAQLLELNYAVSLSQKQLKTLKADIRVAIQDKKQLLEDIQALQAELERHARRLGIAYA